MSRWSRTRPWRSGRPVASRSGRGRRRRSTCARTSPASSASPSAMCASSRRRWAASFGAKTFVRTEAIVAALARKAGRPVQGRARPRRGVRHAQPPPGDDPRAARRPARRDARRQGGRLLGRHRRLRRLRPRRRAEARATPASGRTGSRTCASTRSAIYTNLPPNGAFRGYGAMQSVWASERAMDVLADRLGMSPLELRRKNLLRDGDALRHRRGHARRPLRGAASRRRPTRSATRRTRAGKGLCVLLKGMQTPSRAAVRVERTPVGYDRPLAPRAEMGQGVAALDPADGRRAAGVRAGPDRGPATPTPTASPYDTRTTSSRSTHMMGRALRRGGRATCAPTAASAASARSATRAASTPTPARAIASTHWHQGAAARPGRGRRGDRQGRPSSTSHAVRLRRAASSTGPGAELQNEGSMIMGLGTRALRGARLRRRPGRQREPLRLQHRRRSADLPARFTHELIEREGAEVARARRDRRCRRSRRRSATRCASLGRPTSTSCRSHAERGARGASTPRGGRVNIDVQLNGTATTLQCAPTSMLLDVLRDAGPHVGPRDLRDRRLRRLHRAARRRARVRLPDDGRAGRRAATSPPSRDSRATTRSQRAFVEHHAFQCGWCTPGFVLTAKDLLDDSSDPQPTRRSRGARRQPVPLRLLREDHRGRRGGRGGERT